MFGQERATSPPCSSRTASTASRTGYACDACRRQKIKCDGTQPCNKCEQSGLICTYGSTGGRTAVGYTRQLEQKIAELQALIREQPQTIEPTTGSRTIIQDVQHNPLIWPGDDYIIVSNDPHQSLYHGRLRGQSEPLSEDGELFMEDCSAQMAGALDSSAFDLPSQNTLADFALLLSQQRLEQTISVALDNALVCKEGIDRIELWSQIEVLSMKETKSFDTKDRSMLALVYALMALGRKHSPDDTQQSLESDSRPSVVIGLNYFRASRAILDSLVCTDLNSIMALCCLASYLLSVSMISKAYTCICTAVSGALMIGLHLPSSTFRNRLPKEELTRRRRAFSALKLMDTVVSSVLGVPNVLRDADPSQAIPVPEEDLGDEGTSLVEKHPTSPLTEAILFAKLYRILSKIIESRHPHPNAASTPSGAHILDYRLIDQLETEIEAWHRSLPATLPEEADQRALRSQMHLRLHHAAVEVSLYRPFLHHLNRGKGDAGFDYRGYAFGSSCLRASAQISYIVESMDKHGFLHEAQWYTIYSLSLAASSLMFFVNRWKKGPTVEESRAAAARALVLLRALGEANISARRCHASLIDLFNKDLSSGGTPMSPRSRFMQSIGAMESGEDQATFPRSLRR